MPSMLPQPKLTRVNEEVPPVPPVPAIPLTINSERKVSISTSGLKKTKTSSGNDGRKNNKSTDGHRPLSSTIKKNRPRGTVCNVIYILIA
jgi:hypothetical protein